MQADISRDFMVQQMTKTNHILHLVLSLITAGFWVPVWILCAMNNASKRSQLNGGTVGKVIHWTGNILYAGLAIVLLITFVAMGIAALVF